MADKSNSTKKKIVANVTMQDVATAAGVSLATVSHVVNKTRFVRPDTVDLVMRAITETGYTPNTLARSLARNSSSSVGLVFSWISNPYFADIIGAIESECYKAGLSVLLSETNDDPEKELKVIQDLHQRRVDGIFLAPGPDPEGRSLQYMKSNNIPVVIIDRMLHDPFDRVGLDNREAIRLLVEHLHKHKYRDIAFLPGHDGYDTTMERIAAFTEFMAFYGLESKSRVTSPSNTAEEATELTMEIIKARKPDALVTGNNLATIGAMKALRDLGLKVPSDIALVGVDDFEWADSFEPRLTVIAQPCKEIGHNAAILMKSRIKTPSQNARSVYLAPKLVVRNSCGCKS